MTITKSTGWMRIPLGCPGKSALTVAQALSTAQYVLALFCASLIVGARFSFRRKALNCGENLNPQIAYPFCMRYILGFDGGGTKTECVLMNSADQVLARTFAGPSNPSRIGVESAVRAIEECGNLALRETGLERSAISAVGAGIAGTAKPEMKESVTRAPQESFAGASIIVLTDLEAGLAAAGEGPAIILVMGTGSAAFGRNAEGEIARAGGYGPASSDQGSAYDIGRRAIASAIRERVGESDSALGRQILEQLRCTEWPVVQHRAQTIL